MKSRDQFRTKFAQLGGLEPLFDEFGPVMPRELNEIENRLGTMLPESYRDFLLEIGGTTFGNAIIIEMVQASPHGGFKKQETVDYLFGAKCERHLGLLVNINLFANVLPAVIPIGGDLLGNLVCLGIEGDRQGKVFFWDHDFGELCLAAHSFEDFLNRLEVYVEPGAKPVRDIATLLEDEWRHLHKPPEPEEHPCKSLLNPFVCSGNASLVLERTKEVMRLVNIASRSGWPKDWRKWEKVFPGWFISRCTLREPEHRVDPSLSWLPPSSRNAWASERRVEMDRPWPLSEWAFWMAPERRKWFWWEGVLIDAGRVEMHVEISDWPAAIGSLDWLGRAAGAYRLLAEE